MSDDAHTLAASLRRAGPIAAAGVIANGANLVVTVLIAHLLTSRGYGTLTQLIALFLVLSMPGSALLIGVVRRVAAWRGPETDAWIARMRRRAGMALACFAVVAVIVRAPLAHLMALPHPAGVTEILLAAGGWALLCVERGLLQSRQDYRRLARNLCVEAGTRTVLTVALVGIGLGVEGAALAVVASVGVALFDARRSFGRVDGHAVAGPGRRPDSSLVADVLAALVGLGLLAALQNVDVLIVGREAPAASGQYGAISVASKAVVFGAIVIAAYLLPEAVIRRHQGGHALHQLAVALGLVAIPVLALVGTAAIAPRLVLRVAFGPDKTNGAGAFLLLALAMGALCASVLFTHYLLGVGERRVLVILGAATAALVVGLVSAHGHLRPTGVVELACQSTVATVLGLAVLRTSRVKPQVMV